PSDRANRERDGEQTNPSIHRLSNKSIFSAHDMVDLNMLWKRVINVHSLKPEVYSPSAQDIL
ncbi:MAG TPA: hypothetical protein VN857_01115, partial [Chthoniobacterales bacterium]|nr:hypothetical protein [Chthoniobacterales bacterium]